MTTRPVRPPTVVDRVLSALGELLITLGVLLMLFVGWQLWWTDVVSERAQADTADDLRSTWSGSTPAPADEVPVDQAPTVGDAFALIHIPRFGSDFDPRPVVEGTTTKVLRDGVGHYRGTAMPGGLGNVALAGHRVTYGRPFFQIEELQDHDPVILETEAGWYTYRVTSHEIVSPRDVAVIDPVPRQPQAQPTRSILTLTACHPRYSARQRYIVHADFESFRARADGPPSSVDEVAASDGRT
ncbi:MAG: class E sortase [Actinomycetales bacterium]